MLGDGRMIEIQMSAEGSTFTREQMDAILSLADKGIGELVQAQMEAVS